MPAIRLAVFRARPGDAEHPGELHLTLADGRELTHPIHRDSCWGWCRDAFDVLMRPETFKGRAR